MLGKDKSPLLLFVTNYLDEYWESIWPLKCLFTTISDSLGQCCPVELSAVVAIMNLKCGQHSSECLPICSHFYKVNLYYDFGSFKNAMDKAQSASSFWKSYFWIWTDYRNREKIISPRKDIDTTIFPPQKMSSEFSSITDSWLLLITFKMFPIPLLYGLFHF